MPTVLICRLIKNTSICLQSFISNLFTFITAGRNIILTIRDIRTWTFRWMFYFSNNLRWAAVVCDSDGGGWEDVGGVAASHLTSPALQSALTSRTDSSQQWAGHEIVNTNIPPSRRGLWEMGCILFPYSITLKECKYVQCSMFLIKDLIKRISFLFSTYFRWTFKMLSDYIHEPSRKIQWCC